MVKKNMRGLGLICLLNVGHSFAMESLSSEKKDFICSVNGDLKNEGQVAMLECPDDLKTIRWDDFLKAFSSASKITYNLESFYEFDLNGCDVQISSNSYSTVNDIKLNGIKINETNKIEYYNIQRNRCVFEIIDYVYPYNRNEHYRIGLSFIKKDTNKLIQILDGELVHNSGGYYPCDVSEKTTFKIKELLKADGSIDLSDPIFGNASNYVLITTNPEKFFIKEMFGRMVILIAPRFLIEAKLETTTQHFKPIMGNWNVDQAPIGIFYRNSRWENLDIYAYLTTANLVSISKNNLFENWIATYKDGMKEDYYKDIHWRVEKVIREISYHEVTNNPVLDGELVHNSGGYYPFDVSEKTTFKIRELLKADGSINLSDPLFENASNYVLITTNPEKFFIKEMFGRMVILIAPRFLIEAKLETTTQHFKPIMGNWNVDQAPIGIFYRNSRWENLDMYDYLTTANLVSISKNNLFENWITTYKDGMKEDYYKDIHWRVEKVIREISYSF